MNNMTDKTNQAQDQPAQVSKEGIAQKIVGGFSWWLGSLTGKPVSKRTQPVVPQVGSQAPAPPTIMQEMPRETVPYDEPETQVPVQTSPKEEPIGPSSSTLPAPDPVAQDLESLKKLVGKFSGKVKTSVGPQMTKATSSTSTSFVKTVDKGFIKKILRVFLVIVFLMIAVFVGMKLFKTYQENGGGVSPTGTVTEPTVTPIVYEPFKPSLYAEDPEILKLEEDIDVLVREISGSNIKEITLNPPTLDFNITF